ncbi:hypothetical protein WJX84_007088 [Apatococcus fuscideae]|uniref:F-ATPase gamma subunit n=1 Tax=Apatococcus fuscideae TaxID=2026836 RepID=A0AAW1TFE7_9CHLO
MALRRAAQRAVQQIGQQARLEEHALEQAVGCSPLSFLSGAITLDVAHASQLAVKQQMRSVQNIQKITKAMKMVAASKMRVAQASTEKSRGITQPLVTLLGDLPATDVERNVAVAITSDKGLCGGINTTIAKAVRGTLTTTGGEDKQNSIVVIGEKGKAQLQRTNRSEIHSTMGDMAKIRITFPLASAVSEELLKTEYDAARILYNRFVSAIAFKPTLATVLSPDALERSAEAGGKIDTYEIEGADRSQMLQDLAEFNLAVTMYNGLLENSCSENASRMAAMESSTNNASDLLSKLTLSYNRTRQAAITTELTEIVSGAAALEG